MTMVVLFIFVPILVAILLALNVLLAVHRPHTEKVTPYECGFNPIYGQVRAPFAIQYYLVGILFFIFHLEIAVLYPLAVTLYQVSVYGFWVAMIFLVLLTIGFVYEFGKGALKFTDHRSSINRAPIEA
uniref:NADH-ubiquinone oxidoreductase chain 3 n=1 Tax=Sporobolomyces sp. TaxID=1928706 RepID=A0A890JIM8_9BASI|nr:NADH dehydrogenase subunit 3 [Sporobolomyces sp.]